uniref:Threonylcarbamoyl-AMP synthase n=2 Tax=Macrostomum lignano TaxID=282301 RepID=A0A1I8G2Y0_9PLAT
PFLEAPASARTCGSGSAGNVHISTRRNQHRVAKEKNMRIPLSVPTNLFRSRRASTNSRKILSAAMSLANNGLAACVDAAADALLRGGIVALPTDTVYGLACLADCPVAVGRVYAVKGRSSGKPLAVCLDSAARVPDYTIPQDGCSVNAALLKDLLPGPVTLVLPRGPRLSDRLNPGVSAVGIRVPDHPFILALCRRIRRPVALTSANASGASDSLRPDDFSSLWPDIDLLIDGGCLKPGPASTVVELMPAARLYRVLRTGRALESTACRLARHGYRLEGAEACSSGVAAAGPDDCRLPVPLQVAS